MFPIAAIQAQGLTGTNMFSDAERRRRHSVLKLGLMACFAMLLIDSLHVGNGDVHGLRGVPAKKKDYEIVSVNDSSFIRDQLSGANLSSISPLNRSKGFDDNFVSGEKVEDFKEMNEDSKDPNDISGVFKGEWILSSPFGNKNYTQEKGRLLMQLKSVVIRNLPSLRYVYGILRVYAALPTVSGDMLIPVQGLLEVANNEITLLSTPLKTQFISILRQPLEDEISGNGSLRTFGLSHIRDSFHLNNSRLTKEETSRLDVNSSKISSKMDNKSTAHLHRRLMGEQMLRG